MATNHNQYLGNPNLKKSNVKVEFTKEQIQEIITNNTFSGVSAQLRFAEWRKINA